jgi:hypothetical protein
MADKWPLANGNWSSAANWNGGTKPAAGDDVFADGKTIAIDEDVTVLSIRNTLRSGGTLGGQFNVSGTRSIVANLTSTTNASIALMTVSPSSGQTVTITGAIGGNTTNNTPTITHNSVGSLVINGNVEGGTSDGARCLRMNAAGITVINGNVSGGSAGTASAIFIEDAGHVVTVNGNVTATGSGAVRYTVSNNTITINGSIIASTSAPAIYATSATSGTKVIHSGTLQSSSNGKHPIGLNDYLYLIHSTALMTHTYRVNVSGTAGSERSLTTAGANQAATSDVRFGTSYGGGTGSLRVPAPEFVAAGVLTDNTVGTYAGGGATPEEIWTYADRSLTETVELDPAVRVKLHATQPDYVPATAAALATTHALLQLTDTDVAAMEARLPSDPADQSAVEAAITAATSPLATSSALSTAAGNITTILGKFTGITLLARWLGALAGKTADTTTRTEINATTAGAGYNETTDSQEAIRDRGDSAWITGSGGGGGGTTTIVTLQAAAGISPGVIVGPSEPLVIGDDYLTVMNRSVRINLLDADGDPAEVEYGTYALDDAGISIQMLLAKSGKPSVEALIVGTCTFFPAVGSVPPYLIVEFTKVETAKAIPGPYDMQVEAVWNDGKTVTFAPYGQIQFARNIGRRA